MGRWGGERKGDIKRLRDRWCFPSAKPPSETYQHTYTNMIFALIKLLCLQHVSITQRVCVHVRVPSRGVHIIGISLFNQNVV